MVDITKLKKEGKTEKEIEIIINESAKKYRKEMLEYYNNKQKINE